MINIQNYNNNLFTLHVAVNTSDTYIKMQTLNTPLNTLNLPTTLMVLKKNLPGVLKSKCFNNHHFPFAKEVQATEVGHLFEHILLEYLCELKLARGALWSKFSGVTEWNWKKDPKGVFYITISVGQADRQIFNLALAKTIQLTEFIINSSINNTSETHDSSTPLSLIQN